MKNEKKIMVAFYSCNTFEEISSFLMRFDNTHIKEGYSVSFKDLKVFAYGKKLKAFIFYNLEVLHGE